MLAPLLEACKVEPEAKKFAGMVVRRAEEYLGTLFPTAMTPEQLQVKCKKEDLRKRWVTAPASMKQTDLGVKLSAQWIAQRHALSRAGVQALS
jgi:hypothetical protein